jgi:hypothetical protein
MRGLFLLLSLLVLGLSVKAQDGQWIRRDSTLWGIRDGIVVGLYPGAIENLKPGSTGGPRGLLRVGYEYKGFIYLVNFIAIEPVVNGKMEFSEISPSAVDGKWGKLMQVGDTSMSSQTLSLYVHMEKFANGAHPYLKLSIDKNQPDELAIEIFQEPDSAPMERCGITATMGNYSRLRKLYLKDGVINSRQLYAGYQGIDFIEKEPYSGAKMLKDGHGDPIVLATTDELFAQLADWPQQPAYQARWNWRYRPFYPLTQYWRKEKAQADQSLQVRVNGRATYWSGGSKDPKQYIAIPGGPAFENFELREKYREGQKVYFGISRKTVEQLLAD